jgi:hypothetical protein
MHDNEEIYQYVVDLVHSIDDRSHNNTTTHTKELLDPKHDISFVNKWVLLTNFSCNQFGIEEYNNLFDKFNHYNFPSTDPL